MTGFSFRQKVLVLIVALVTAIQLFTLFPVLSTIRIDVDARARETVNIGGAVFQEFMANRAEQLRTTVNILVSDFGFKQAAASGEIETIRSALINHSERIGATVAMLLDTDGRLIASSAESSRLTQIRTFSNLLSSPQVSEVAHTVSYIDGAPYQIITVPLRSPLTVAWVAMGFPIDTALASRIANLTGLDVSFVHWSGDQVKAVASTLSLERSGDTFPQLGLQQLDFDQAVLLEQSDGNYLTLLRPFMPGVEDVYVVLQLSMSEITASYRNVRTIFLLITSISLFLAVSGGFWLATSVTKPVSSLVAAARRMREGVYTEPIDVQSSDELGELAEGFNAMQEAIADREERIVYQATHDSLSGLPKRALIFQRLQEQLETEEPFTLLNLAIDGFSRLESSLGHRAGDRVIELVAGVLRDSMDDDQFLGHPGGNEFVILLPRFEIDSACQWVERLSRALHAGVKIQEANLSLRASVGIARYPNHSADSDELMVRASVARNEANARRDLFAVYRPGQEEHYIQQLKIVGDFPRAIQDKELVIHFQPKIDCRTREVLGAEALVRWQHPEFGLLMPDTFIDALEQAGSIGHLTHWVIEEAVGNCREWAAQGVNLGVAINLSVDDLLDDYLPYYLLEVTNNQELLASSLTLEVTENAVMRDASQALMVLDCIRQLGFRVSIDDFGTGQSSLAQLKRLPLDELKIDRSFVMNMPDAKDEAIIRATIELAHHLSLSVVAEGVESEEVLTRLQSLGCEHAQGYHISPPIPAEAFCDWVRQWRRRENAEVIPQRRRSSS